MRIVRYKRFWAVYETSGALLCVCVYKKGAQAVINRLTPPGETPPQYTPPPRKPPVRTRKERYDAQPCQPCSSHPIYQTSQATLDTI